MVETTPHMKPDPEKSIRYGIMPMGMMALGFVTMLVVAFGTTKVLDFLRWLVDWRAGGP